MSFADLFWRRPGRSLDKAKEVAELDLDPFTFDLRTCPRDAMTAAEAQQADRHLRRLLLEEIFPNAIRPLRSARLANVYRDVHRRSVPVHALCLSGGGIRSASFSLGVLQALAKEGWLNLFDYLSTVSGGGYIGGWLSAWSKQDGTARSFAGLHQRSANRTLEPEEPPIRHLRTYSNYLSPQLGLLSADTWTLVATYLRNLTLNWLVLVPLLTALALLPWIAVANVAIPREWLGAAADEWLRALTVVGIGLATMAVRYTHLNRPDGSGRRDINAIPMAQRQQTYFLKFCLLPLLVSMSLLSTALVWGARWEVVTPEERFRYFVQGGIAIHTMGWVFAFFEATWTWRRHFWRKVRDTLVELLVVMGSGALAGVIAHIATSALIGERGDLESAFALKRYVLFAAPTLVILILAASFAFTGFTSRAAGEPEREWSARFAAWLLIPVVAWLAIGGLVLFGPDALGAIPYGEWIGAGLGAFTGISVAGFGKSAATAAMKKEGADGKLSVLKSLPASILATLGAVTFAALLVVGLSMLGTELLREFTCAIAAECKLDWRNQNPLAVMITAAALFAFGLLAARFVDTNRFSLHAMYRSRLMRTFLGASRRGSERRADPFTGFDENDDLPMAALAARQPIQRPFHVINMALNLVGGNNLAWQTRKARSFTVTPLHAGSIGLGYRRVKPRSGPVHRVYGGEDRGISLATAMTISGAAASPNMGYHSKPLVTFLMTFFNLRLGWWLGNPGPAGNETFFRSQPKMAVRPLVDELFGRTNDRNKYVYLSDGGHFENLGLYEMIHRRCGRIIVVDASADPKGTFDDLGNAIRLIAIDFGIPISFGKPFNIYARGTAPAGQPVASYAVGQIEYSAVDGPAAPAGTVYYIKPTYYGEEPRDVFSYGKASPTFPHESTADQFFDEPQLESYRALGHFIADEFIADLKKKNPTHPFKPMTRLPP